MTTPNLDLNNKTNITQMVHCFYERLLADELMAPVFLEVAKIDINQHLPTISLYWQKMLLGDKSYKNNTMAKHRSINKRQPFTEQHYDAWLNHFLITADQNFSGPYTEKAKRIATNVIKNMKKQLTTT